MKKKSILFLSILVFSLCLACKSTSNTPSKMQYKNQTSQNETSNLETDERVTEIQNDNNVRTPPQIQNINGSTGGNMNIITGTSNSTSTVEINNPKMYSDLKMTKEQIRTFELEMEKFRKRQRNSANGEMLGTIPSERDRQLKSILTTEQLKNYEEWKKKK